MFEHTEAEMDLLREVNAALLAAAKAAEEFCDGLEPGGKITMHVSDLREQLRAAIAAAEGGEG